MLLLVLLKPRHQATRQLAVGVAAAVALAAALFHVLTLDRTQRRLPELWALPQLVDNHLLLLECSSQWAK